MNSNLFKDHPSLRYKLLNCVPPFISYILFYFCLFNFFGNWTTIKIDRSIDFRAHNITHWTVATGFIYLKKKNTLYLTRIDHKIYLNPTNCWSSNSWTLFFFIWITFEFTIPTLFSGSHLPFSFCWAWTSRDLHVRPGLGLDY